MRNHCGVCGDDIPLGQLYHTLVFHREREYRGGWIDIEHTQILLVWCGTCVPSKTTVTDALTDVGLAEWK
jgi:hypothetical protein